MAVRLNGSSIGSSSGNGSSGSFQATQPPASREAIKKEIRKVKGISDFMAGTAASFARPNLFEVQITPPSALSSTINDLQNLTIRCYSVSLPPLSISSSEEDHGYRSIAYSTGYETADIGFYMTENFAELQFFEDWMKLMVFPDSDRVGLYDSYAKEASVTVINLDRQDQPSMKTKLNEAFPKAISAIPLEWGTNDEIMKITVTFEYRDISREYIKHTSAPHADKKTEQGKVEELSALSNKKTISNILDKTTELTKNAQGRINQ
jgi:hypothetical protein